jgi:hypothetical protein
VITLIVVTVFALRDSFNTLLQGDDDEPEDVVDVNLMLIFSGANLLLDVVNVTCFARAHQAFGLTEVRLEGSLTRFSVRDELPNMVELEHLTQSRGEDDEQEESEEVGPFGEKGGLFLNLNMCSAWTVSCPMFQTTRTCYISFLSDFNSSSLFFSTFVQIRSAVQRC